MSHEKEFQKAVRNHKYEETESGILFPAQSVVIGGVFENELIRGGESLGVEASPNLVVNEGLNHVLNAVFNATDFIAPWYVSIFETNYTPLATVDASTIVAAAGESTNYSDATRPEYVEVASTAQSITNSASKASFSINGTATIYGAFLVSTNTKAGGTGVLMSVSQFGASRAVLSGDTLLVTYTLNITSV